MTELLHDETGFTLKSAHSTSSRWQYGAAAGVLIDTHTHTILNIGSPALMEERARGMRATLGLEDDSIVVLVFETGKPDLPARLEALNSALADPSGDGMARLLAMDPQGNTPEATHDTTSSSTCTTREARQEAA